MSQPQLIPDGNPDLLYNNEWQAVKALKSPYDSVYWFARALIGSEYGGKGGDNRLMLRLSQRLQLLLSIPSPDLEASKSAVWQFFRELHRADTAVADKVEKLINYLDSIIVSTQDLAILKFTIDHVLIPTNALIRMIPTSDAEAAEDGMRAYLSNTGEAGLKDVILMWDRVGRDWSMAAERVAIIAGFRLLRATLETLMQKQQADQLDSDTVLTAFVQEFERRLARGVRPARAGRSLEDVTGLILEHFGITRYEDAPSHIKTVFEVDKMITMADGWRVGVSCKRTLRERWKQAASLNLDLMDRLKIRNTWHVITYTSDLTVAKIEAIGESRGVVFIPDGDHFLLNHKDNPSVSKFIHPMTSFIAELKRLDSLGL